MMQEIQKVGTHKRQKITPLARMRAGAPRFGCAPSKPPTPLYSPIALLAKAGGRAAKLGRRGRGPAPGGA